MKIRTSVFSMATALVLVLAGCATDGAALAEISDGLSDYAGAEITTEGQVGRGVPVSGTDLTVYQFGDGEHTVAVLSTAAPEHGESRRVTGRVVPFTGDFEALEEEEENAREAIAEYLDESGVSEAALEAATDQSFGLVRTFTVSNNATFFLLEEDG